MSIPLKLSTAELNHHCNSLRFIPKIKNKRGMIVNGDPIYLLHRGEGDIVYLPLRYSLNLGFVMSPTPDLDMQFTGELYEDKIIPIRQCMEQLRLHNTTLLDIPTGFGKTIIGAYAACQLNGLTAVLVNRLPLIDQWSNTFTNNTNASVYIFDKKTQYNNEQVIIVMCRRVKDLPPNIRDYIRFLIVDEADTFLTKEGINAMLGIPTEYLMLQSATPVKVNGLHSMYKQLVGEHSVVVPRTKPFIYCSFYTGIKVVRRKDMYGEFSWSEVVSELSKNTRRDDMIINYALINHKQVTLVLCREIEHAKLLCEQASTSLSSDYIAGSKNNFINCSFYAGTTSKVGRGFDLCSHTGSSIPIDHVIIVDSIANPVTLTQAAGRAREHGALVTHIIDDDPAMTRHDTNAREWALNNGCVQIVEVHGSDYVGPDESSTQLNNSSL